MSLREFQGLLGREAAVRNRIMIKADPRSHRRSLRASPPARSSGRRSCWPRRRTCRVVRRRLTFNAIADLRPCEVYIMAFRFSLIWQARTSIERDFERSPDGSSLTWTGRDATVPCRAVGGADDCRWSRIRWSTVRSDAERSAQWHLAASTDRAREDLAKIFEKIRERGLTRGQNRRILALVNGGNSFMIAWVIVLVFHRIYI